MTIKSTALIAALLASTSPAFAQGANATFHGPFVGVGLGAVNDNIGAGVLEDQDQWSAAFTGYVGYDYALPNNFVVGLEAGAAYSVDDDQLVNGTAGAFNLNPQYEINATGRVGYLLRPNLLVYGRGGYGNLRSNIETTGVTSDDLSDGSDGWNLGGWLVGGGVEYALMWAPWLPRLIRESCC